MPVYLDHNATTRVDARVVEAMLPYLQGAYGNPSSLHRYGRASRDAVEQARVQVAALVGAQPQEVVWTSGGTESNNLAIKGSLDGKPARILYGATEHPAVMECAESLRAVGHQVDAIAVDARGIVDWQRLETQLNPSFPRKRESIQGEPEKLDSRFRGNDDRNIKLISLMRANNETGVIQDVARAAVLAHRHGALLHVDAVQAAGKIPLDFAALDADLMSLSSHKIYGPKGIGALIVKNGTELHALHHGGPQEKGLRGGTENMPAIVGFGVAAELAAQELDARMAHVRALRDALEGALVELPQITIFGQHVERLPNTVQFSVSGYDGEALLMQLDRKGFGVSSGSACASGLHEPSHVLLAMGYSRDVALGAIRVSFGQDNQPAQVQEFMAALKQVIGHA